MRRTRSKFVKLISVSNKGDISSLNTKLSNDKDRFIRAAREPYKATDRESYRQYSKSIEDRVNKFKALKEENKKLELLARKNTARVIANSLNKIILNSEEDDSRGN